MNSLERLFGGPPLRTLLWLCFVSIVIGFVLTTLGLHPFTLAVRLYNGVRSLFNAVFHLGLDSFVWLGRYLLYGAVVVVPVWIVMRVFSMGRRG
jgi:hypothetical protein